MIFHFWRVSPFSRCRLPCLGQRARNILVHENVGNTRPEIGEDQHRANLRWSGRTQFQLHFKWEPPIKKLGKGARVKTENEENDQIIFVQEVLPEL